MKLQTIYSSSFGKWKNNNLKHMRGKCYYITRISVIQITLIWVEN